MNYRSVITINLLLTYPKLTTTQTILLSGISGKILFINEFSFLYVKVGLHRDLRIQGGACEECSSHSF